jgi:hypothetical protein
MKLNGEPAVVTGGVATCESRGINPFDYSPMCSPACKITPANAIDELLGNQVSVVFAAAHSSAKSRSRTHRSTWA